MWMVTLGRARAAIAGCAEIGARLQCARRQFTAGAASALGELAHSRRDIHHQPVPEAGASRRVGIVAGDSKALCARWRARPFEMRRPVAAGATKTEFG